MAVRGIRGATSVDENSKAEIVAKTRELLVEIVNQNGIDCKDIASVIFSATTDVDAEFPAIAARELGWIYTPLLCTNEIPVPGSLSKCIRVLLHANTDRHQEQMVHVYLHEARKLRPDLHDSQKDHYYVSEK